MKKVSTVRPPSSVACGATFPLKGEGYCGGTSFLCSTFHLAFKSAIFQNLTERYCGGTKFFMFYFSILPENRRCIKRLRIAVEAFPFEGEGGAAGDG